MLLEEVIEFLGSVPPFQFLDEAALRKIAGSISIEFYPKGTMILKQEGPASEYLKIIKKGGVKVFVRSADGEEIVIDYRSEGDSFGFLSLVSGDKSRANVVAVEDTIAYLVSSRTVKGLLDANPSFTEYFLKSFLNKYIDKTYKEMHSKSLLYGNVDKLLFTTPVGELASREVMTASQEISIREAADIMSQHRISSLVLTYEDGVPAGIVTDRDLRDKVVARGRNVSDPIKNIMSVSLIKSDAGDFCFDALLKMIRYNIHHLLVVEEGRLKGILTNHDLLMLQGTSPISIVREIENQRTIEGLIHSSRKTRKIVELLLKEGAKASNITKIITEINDRMVKKILTLAEKRFGLPPLTYCWLVFGSEGRKEQTFATDQDNAIIHDDPGNEEEAKAAEEYFAKFSAFVTDSLVQCGFPQCSGGYMASNPLWRQPVAVWKEYFSRWVDEPTPEAILFSVILFDFRPVHGDFLLAEKLREHLRQILEGQGIFLKLMADLTVKLRPPLGFFRTFVVEKSGEHKDKLNLKFRCIAPLIDIVRLFSLEKRIAETSTLERLEALRETHVMVREFGDELEHAFEFITLLRIHHQFNQIQEGQAPDNFIDPNGLSNLEKKTLKEACQLISRVQDMIMKQYNPGTTL